MNLFQLDESKRGEVLELSGRSPIVTTTATIVTTTTTNQSNNNYKATIITITAINT